jgi:tRNA (guanine37-N1)-methyltransferase
MIKFKIFTIFPELFPQILSTSIMGEALKNNLWNIEIINIRDYASDFRKTVDDTPYGGGAGMLYKVDVLHRAIQNNIDQSKKPLIIYPSPRGELFNQKIAQNLSKESEINIICGRYEGVDQRIIDIHNIKEVSIGDYIISGGEIASYVIIDAILRNIPNILGKSASIDEESFGSIENDEYEYLLEYPHYTRPYEFLNQKVPDVLLSGNHKNIEKWRKEKALEITQRNRPDLYKKYLEKNNK